MQKTSIEGFNHILQLNKFDLNTQTRRVAFATRSKCNLSERWPSVVVQLNTGRTFSSLRKFVILLISAHIVKCRVPANLMDLRCWSRTLRDFAKVAQSCMSLQLGSIFGVWSHNRALWTSCKYLSIRMMRPKQSIFSVNLLPLEKYIDMPMPLTVISLPKCTSHVSICQLVYEWRLMGTGKFEEHFWKVPAIYLAFHLRKVITPLWVSTLTLCLDDHDARFLLLASVTVFDSKNSSYIKQCVRDSTCGRFISSFTK